MSVHNEIMKAISNIFSKKDTNKLQSYAMQRLIEFKGIMETDKQKTDRVDDGSSNFHSEFGRLHSVDQIQAQVENSINEQAE